MPRPSCPVCGDPSVYALWVGKAPLEGCPYDAALAAGKPATIRTVTDCTVQMKRAWQAAQFRKLVPDAFDAAGVVRPGQLGRVLQAFGRAHPGKALVL